MPANLLSRSISPTTPTALPSNSRHDSNPSNLAVAAALLHSTSAIARTLASSHPAASVTEPASVSDSAPAPPRTTSWYSVPNTRGTWDLLITCLITINLCVWTAIHLHIPPKADKAQPFKKRLWNNYYCRRARWALLGLLAPELVVYTAWMQWESARKFAKDTGTTLTHGFYAGMGAYCIEPEAGTTTPHGQEHGPSQLYGSIYADREGRISGLKRMIPRARDNPKLEEGPSSLYLSMLRDSNKEGESQPASIQTTGSSLGWTADSCPRLYLTAAGVLKFFLAGRISLPTEENIAERSKSDLIAKTLVCLQAGYIIVQCVSRLASGLPLTFLEINTLGHVLCALVMYVFWFHKSQGLSLSIALEPDLANQLRTWYRCGCYAAAWPTVVNEHAATTTLSILYRVVWERAKSAGYLEMVEGQSPSPTSLQAAQVPAKEPSLFAGYPTELAVVSLTGDDFLLVLRVFDDEPYVEEIITSGVNVKMWKLFTGIYIVPFLDDLPKYVKESSRVRASYTWGGFASYDSAIRHLLDTQTEPINFRLFDVKEEIENWPSQGLLSGHTPLPSVAIAISTALYGGLHAAAWRSFFPSLVEKWLWRVSSIVIAGSGMCFALGVAVDSFHWWLLESTGPSVTYQGGGLGRRLYRAVSVFKISIGYLTGHSKIKVETLCTLAIICVASRIFLVVEAFISLRKVPIEVYQTPDWTQWIPHL